MIFKYVTAKRLAWFWWAFTYGAALTSILGYARQLAAGTADAWTSGAAMVAIGATIPTRWSYERARAAELTRTTSRRQKSSERPLGG